MWRPLRFIFDKWQGSGRGEPDSHVVRVLCSICYCECGLVIIFVFVTDINSCKRHLLMHIMKS
jgi:hypothetical protein